MALVRAGAAAVQLRRCRMDPGGLHRESRPWQVQGPSRIAIGLNRCHAACEANLGREGEGLGFPLGSVGSRCRNRGHEG
eukprot:2352468-Amphidinium_carterae.1